MKVIALTGGIGSGKSEVARILSSASVEIIDADVLSRDVLRAGSPTLDLVVAHFGNSILSSYGELDRKALAGRVFGDPQELRFLNSVVHPVVFHRILDELQALRKAALKLCACVVVPLLVETQAYEVITFDAIIVVDVDEEVAFRRLVELRGMSPQDARARIRAQVARKERLQVAHFVIDNNGSLEELTSKISDVLHAVCPGIANQV